MDAGHLHDIRKRINLTQSEMANAMGISLRTYVGLENGEVEFRELHRLAVQFLSLQAAVTAKKLDIAEPEARRAAINYVQLLQGGV